MPQTHPIPDTRSFYERHKSKIWFFAGLSLAVVLNKVALRSHDNFLKERGLYDVFYTPDF